jgi:hypothetical protein
MSLAEGGAEVSAGHAIKKYSDFNEAETRTVWGDHPPVRKRLRCSECKSVATTCCVCSISIGLCIKCFPAHVANSSTHPTAEPLVSHAIRKYSDFNEAETRTVWGNHPPIRKRSRCSECKSVATTCCVCSISIGLCIKCFPAHVVNSSSVEQLEKPQ